jgi:hypothetical protein
MRTKLALLFSALIVSTWVGQAFAQSDVCCIMGKKSGTSADTTANVRSPNDCTSGAKDGGYTVCAARQDPNNECSMLTSKDRCTACGYFWAGGTCLSEDPVKKAKQQLKKEDEAKKKKAPEKPAAPTE